MATFKEIRGQLIRKYTTNPTNPLEGQMWYNNTTGTLKGVLVSEAWSSASSMNTAEQNPGGFGIQTAAVSVGGNTPPNSNKTEEYNGSGWTVSGVYPASLIGIGTAGTQTAGLGFGGRDPAGVTTAAEYDGSSWTAATAYPISVSLACGVGPQTAALGATGDVYPASPRYSDVCNDYNGTSWTAAAANVGSARYDAMAAGTATAAAICGGTESASGATEEYNGASWTVGGANLFNISAGGSSKNGTSDDWMVFGGSFPSNNLTAGYDGTSWAATPNLGTSRFGAGGAGTGTAGLCFGGREPGYSTATEEFNKGINVITAGAWASGGALGTTRYQSGTETTGTKTAGLIAGGRGSIPPSNPAYLWVETEEYDGTSWSPGGNIPNSTDLGAMFGTQTAAVLFGGNVKPGGPNPAPGTSVSDQTILYNGASWTAAPVYPATVVSSGGAGTQTAGLGVGGPPALTVCNEFNGAGWTLAGALTTGRSNAQCFGSQVAAGVVSGWPVLLVTEEYNGTSWTAGGDALAANEQGGSSGTQTDALLFGGNVSPTVLVQGYDGTAWSTRPSIATGRYGGASAGAQTDGSYLAGGGGGPPTRQVTEEFTPEVSAVNIKTITTS